MEIEKGQIIGSANPQLSVWIKRKGSKRLVRIVNLDGQPAVVCSEKGFEMDGPVLEVKGDAREGISIRVIGKYTCELVQNDTAKKPSRPFAALPERSTKR